LCLLFILEERMKQTNEPTALALLPTTSSHSLSTEYTLAWSHLSVETRDSVLFRRSLASSLGLHRQKVYEEKSRLLLHDLTGIARPGQILAIMGTSGVGKVSLLIGLYKT
jgi:hypothetical protein